MATISRRDDSDRVTIRVPRYNGGATRRSMNSPTWACHGRSTICHISACT